MRLAVYCDYPYRIQDDRLYAEQPVALFLSHLAPYFDRLTLIGRLDPTPGRFPYAIHDTNFAALPHYSSGADPLSLIRSMPIAVARFWRLLGRVDTAWVLGPTPLSLLFAILACVRGRRLVLGVRQDLPQLFRYRYPDRPLLRFGARVLERAFRALARQAPVVVVGPELARHYRRSPRVHTLYVSLLRERDIAEAKDDRRTYDGPLLRMLSVGRIDPEKNPLLLADVLARALDQDPRWRLDVCGDGPLAGELQQRLAELGIADRATLHGHVPIDAGLVELYRGSHAFLHISLTEGVPQVLLEAFAMRLPVVATAVGGVPDLVHDCGLLIPPRDPDAAAQALSRLSSDPQLRGELVDRAVSRARNHTLEAECARLARFLAETES
jgi:glycosyltransferase involved in cell wall biosynthesis